MPVLIQALRDADTFVRQEAAKALGQIGPDAKDAVPVLRRVPADPTGELQKLANEALRRIEGR